MKMLTAVLSLLVASVTQVLAIETIQAKGSKLFKSGGSQWFVKGITTFTLIFDFPHSPRLRRRVSADR